MDISAAALPPPSPHIDAEDRKHPRFSEYQSYRAAMSRLLVEADSFKVWLRNAERDERDNVLRKHPRFTEFQRWMRETKGGQPHKTKLHWPDTFLAWLKGDRW